MYLEKTEMFLNTALYLHTDLDLCHKKSSVCPLTHNKGD